MKFSKLLFFVTCIVSATNVFADSQSFGKTASSELDIKDFSRSEEKLKKLGAEIDRHIEEENTSPKKKFISPSTKERPYAMYYESVKERVEELGTWNFPQKNGNKLYGELDVIIPLFYDGKIYEEDGGIKIGRSSGNPYLDACAIRLVRRAAPFGRFPVMIKDSTEILEMLVRIKFIDDENNNSMKKDSIAK